MHTHATAGNTFISEVKEHIAQFAEFNLTVELALNPEDESLQVSREKVNRHMYHMLKDGKITMPEPVGVTGCGCNKMWVCHMTLSGRVGYTVNNRGWGGSSHSIPVVLSSCPSS